MATVMPYKYGQQQEDEQDPYARRGPGGVSEPIADDGSSTPETAPAAPQPYKPPASTQSPEKPKGPAMPAPETPTFTELQEAGKARPPMPPAPMVEPPNPAAGVGVGAPPSAIVEPPNPQLPVVPPTMPPEMIEPANPTAGVGVGSTPPDAIIEPPETGLPVVGGESAIIEPPNPGEMVPGEEGESSADSLLPYLLGGLQAGPPENALRDATNTAITSQLDSPSPYDSKAVRDEYDWMAGSIDDDYAQRERATDEGMARRGLFGSAGKDFHSGRLSDLNVGRRSAKATLAQDLGNKYATTAGQYRNAAIGQGLQGAAANDATTGHADAKTLDYINSIMGFGQQAFQNDMSTAQFNRQQDEDTQSFLERLLAQGYGV